MNVGRSVSLVIVPGIGRVSYATMQAIEWSPETAEGRRRKLMMLTKRLRLDRQERLDLSSVILCRDITTWSGLPDTDVVRLLDAYEGYLLLTEIARQKGRHCRCAE